jgi:hypothetical protein
MSVIIDRALGVCATSVAGTDNGQLILKANHFSFSAKETPLLGGFSTDMSLLRDLRQFLLTFS